MNIELQTGHGGAICVAERDEGCATSEGSAMGIQRRPVRIAEVT